MQSNPNGVFKTDRSGRSRECGAAELVDRHDRVSAQGVALVKVLMLGWEFPPSISGGLGTACKGLAKALGKLGVEIIFVLPRSVKRIDPRWLPRCETAASRPSPESATSSPPSPGQTPDGRSESGPEATRRSLSEAGLEKVTFVWVEASLAPYARPQSTRETERRPVADDPNFDSVGKAHRRPPALVGQEWGAPLASRERLGESVRLAANLDAPGLDEQVGHYARCVGAVARQLRFDVIHAHDWMTFPAGEAVRRLSGKPLVVHVHSTELDRGGAKPDRRIQAIERAAVAAADTTIAVSVRTRDALIREYGADPRRARVIYNATEPALGQTKLAHLSDVKGQDQIVLFLGRVTSQKGPEYFLAAAQRVTAILPNVRFMMAGAGDLIPEAKNMAAKLGLTERVFFPGFLQGDDVVKALQLADLLVMPSISEPFGLVALEGMTHGVPVLISRQSGVSEIVHHVLKADFWDIDDMADKIVAVLRYPVLRSTLAEQGRLEVAGMSWMDTARGCMEVYRGLMA